MFDCALFDWVTGQVDRHDGNYLYDIAAKKIVLIDSAHSLTKHETSLPDYLKVFEATQKKKVLKQVRQTEVQVRIRGFSRRDLGRVFPLRDPVEKEALLKRFEQAQRIQKIDDVIHLIRGDHE